MNNKRKQLALDSFFHKKSKCDVIEKTDKDKAIAGTSTQCLIKQDEGGLTTPSSATINSQSSAINTLVTNEVPMPEIVWNDRDFGNLLVTERHLLTDDDKYQWIKNAWIPSPDYSFPLIREGKKNRSFQYNWLKLYPWLAYSKKYNGGLCKCCVLFGRTEGGMNEVKLGKLVLEPLISFKKATETLRNHSNTKYHKENVVASQNFCTIMDGKSNDVVYQIRSSEKALIEENMKKLIPIIKTVIFCGIQNISLRGHRDDGHLNIEESPHGEGNFRALLKFRVDAGDKDLLSHIESCGKNSTYISKTTQNDIIQCFAEVLTKKIATRIRNVKYFTLIVDETTDISLKEQVSICIRYYDLDTYSIKEDFIRFIDVVDVTGENVCRTVLDELSKLNLDIQNCRGQAFDSGSNMSGKFKGVQARIMQLQPLAIYTHCANHRLNLAISKACTVANIRNAIGVISSISNFFRDSAGRLHALDLGMEDKLKKGKHAVKKMCETRWIERHDAVLTFLEALPVLRCVLQTLAQKTSDGSKAFALLHSILSSEFIVSVVILGNVLSITLPLARKLQAESIDVFTAMDLVNATMSCIQDLRENFVEKFKSIFKSCEELCRDLGTDIKRPRVVKVQKNRSNIETESEEEYFRISIYVPFIDYLNSELSARFPKSQMSLIFQFRKLMIPDFEEDFEDSVLHGAELYRDDFPCFSALNGELNIWKQMWLSKPEDMPKHPAQACKFAADLPNLKVLFQIICTLPVTSCTAERSFSTLRRIKTYLRASMTEDRLNGLALLNIHQDLASSMTAEEVLEVLARKNKRKLSLKLF